MNDLELLNAIYAARDRARDAAVREVDRRYSAPLRAAHAAYKAYHDKRTEMAT